MNREERRKRMREYAKDSKSEKCPLCGKKSLFVSNPTKEWLCDVKCLLCNGIVIKDVKDLIPMVYVSPQALLTEKGGVSDAR